MQSVGTHPLKLILMDTTIPGLGKYIDPLSDPGFKILFGREDSKDILIGFLNMLLEESNDDPITDIEYLDKEQVRQQPEERSVIYDIHCQTECGRKFIVEMQNRNQANFIDRTIFYVSRAITEQGRTGDWRYAYMPVYGIFFTNFPIPQADKRLRVDAELRDTLTAKQFSNKLRLIYIQLPFFKKKEPEECDNDFDRWIYLLKNMKTMERMPFTKINDIFRRVEEVSRVGNLTKDELRRYEHDLKQYRDYNNIFQTAQEEGRKEGREEGWEEGWELGRKAGMEKGILKGLQEGIEKEKYDNARNLLKLGVEPSKISEALKIPLEKLSELN